LLPIQYMFFKNEGLNMQKQKHKELFNKIRRLPPEKVAVIDDFVEF